MDHSSDRPIVIAGSSGLIGRALLTELRRQGRTVRRLVRRPAAAADEATWDPAAGTLDGASLEGTEAVINLAGAGIGDRRWTPARKQLLRDSRVGAAALLGATVSGLSRPPEVILSASAMGFYSERGDTIVTENTGPGRGFLAELCQEWEAAAQPEVAVRTVRLRTGVVLSADGPFLRRQLPLFRLGLGGRLGPADRWVSWISLTDTVAAICHLLRERRIGSGKPHRPQPGHQRRVHPRSGASAAPPRGSARTAPATEPSAGLRSGGRPDTERPRDPRGPPGRRVHLHPPRRDRRAGSSPRPSLSARAGTPGAGAGAISPDDPPTATGGPARTAARREGQPLPPGSTR